ncbi:MAG: PadR family transcriptional regulator [Candidatus Dormibacteraeota bacterium]|nr:PadR family transcriptional regulator [Candidatus Dormibacteraeota bacterium]
MPRARPPSPQTAAVIGTFAAEPGRWRHGYDLCLELKLKAGSLYPILVRLADRGLLDATWEASPPPGRPPRHLYRLSPHGVELAATLCRPRPTVPRQVPRLRGAC